MKKSVILLLVVSTFYLSSCANIQEGIEGISGKKPSGDISKSWTKINDYVSDVLFEKVEFDEAKLESLMSKVQNKTGACYDYKGRIDKRNCSKLIEYITEISNERSKHQKSGLCPLKETPKGYYRNNTIQELERLLKKIKPCIDDEKVSLKNKESEIHLLTKIKIELKNLPQQVKWGKPLGSFESFVSSRVSNLESDIAEYENEYSRSDISKFSRLGKQIQKNINFKKENEKQLERLIAERKTNNKRFPSKYKVCLPIMMKLKSLYKKSFTSYYKFTQTRSQIDARSNIKINEEVSKQEYKANSKDCGKFYFD